MTNWIELIESNKEEILSTMKEAEASAYRYPSCEYRVYIDTDGKCGYEEWVANDNGWYQFRGDYERCYIHTFCHQYFDVLWDYWFSDPSCGRDTFDDRFGYPVECDSDNWKTYEEEMRDTVLAHGGTVSDFYSWIGEMTDEAIEDLLMDESVFSDILNVRIEKLCEDN